MFRGVALLVLVAVSVTQAAPAAKPAPKPTIYYDHIHYSEPVVISYDSYPVVYENYAVPEVVVDEHFDDIDYHHHYVVR